MGTSGCATSETLRLVPRWGKLTAIPSCLPGLVSLAAWLGPRAHCLVMHVPQGTCSLTRQEKGGRRRHPGACPRHKGRGAVRNFYLSSFSTAGAPRGCQSKATIWWLNTGLLYSFGDQNSAPHASTGCAPAEVPGGGARRASSCGWRGRRCVACGHVMPIRPCPRDVLPVCVHLCVLISAPLLVRTAVELD